MLRKQKCRWITERPHCAVITGQASFAIEAFDSPLNLLDFPRHFAKCLGKKSYRASPILIQAVDKNLPVNGGDTDSIPGPRRLYLPQGN